MLVPFSDIKAQYVALQSEMDQAVKRVLMSGQYLLGDELSQFEQNFAHYIGTKYCVAVGSGLDALVLILKALDLTEYDEIIVPSFTFIATWLAVSQVGAKLVAVEPCQLTYNMDPHLLKKALTKRTKAIIVVHLYGQPANLAAIKAIADENNIPLIEDAAQAHGAYYQSQRVGSFGLAGAWSFYPGKNLGAFSDGGAITTDNPDIANTLKYLRNYGSQVKYQHVMQGVNSRLDEIQAAILSIKLKHLDDWNNKRQQIAKRYLDELSHVKQLTLPSPDLGGQSVWHHFVIRVANRAMWQYHLQEKGIETGIHYPVPPHKQPAYANKNNQLLPISELLHQQVLSLPIDPFLTHAQISYVIKSICEVASQL